MSTPGVRFGLILVRAYQLLLSPFAGGACRFEPSCSAYAMTAIEDHGLLRGMFLAVKRVARCHPFARPGFDPVPPRVRER
jgi:putative membrane protein insertion efficiency factor